MFFLSGLLAGQALQRPGDSFYRATGSFAKSVRGVLVLMAGTSACAK